MLFHYKTIDANGVVEEGDIERDSKAAFYKELKAAKKTPVFVEEKKKIKWFKKDFEIFSRIKEEEIIHFARNLSSMISAGLPVARALSVIGRQSKKKKFRGVVTSIQDSIKKGQTLSAGLEVFPDIFSDLFVSMVGAGEESGNLAESLEVVAAQMESAYKLKKKIRGAMLYPGIIITVMIIIGILMLIFVVPTLTATFEDLNVDLPATTQFIISLSNFLKNNTFMALGLIVALVGGFVYALKTKTGKSIFDKVILKIPIIGVLVRETNAARTTKTLSSLLLAGVGVVRSIEITSEVIQNVHYRKVLVDMQVRIQKGEVMSTIFKEHEDLYPAFVGEMVTVGEETGKVTDLLEQVAAFYEEDVSNKTKDMSTIVEPFLMVVVGVAVGFFAVSMITPMYSLSSSI